ncbi:MAG: T9SS type A sorting domain-containing protein [Chitinophagaceae bacterium]
MKPTILKFGIILLMIFTLATSSEATTVSGKIYTTGGTYGATPIPVAGATVWIYYNLNATVFVSTTTSSTGNYSITVPATWTSGNLINVMDSVTGCHGSKQFLYGGSNVVQDDTMCNFTWYTIGGKVTYQNGGGVAGAKVWYINEYQDTTRGIVTNSLKAYDSTTTDAMGDYLFAKTGYWINATQKVKAALPTSNPNYANYLPTYHDSALVWSSATNFSGTSWSGNARNLDISLRGGTNPGGPGFISGNVLLGANKGTGVGDPLSSRILLLTTATGTAIAYTYSDASGQINFSNLPVDNYLIFGDAWGKTNPPLALSITTNTPAVNGVVFEENNTTFKGHLNNLGVSAGSLLQEVSIYPLPVESYFEINNLQRIPGQKVAILVDIIGRTILSKTTIDAAANTTRISMNELPAGLYFLELQTSEGKANYKLIKK